MAAVACFYKTPAQAKRIGKVVRRREIVKASDAKRLRDYYRNVSTNQKSAVGLAASILAGAMIKSAVAAFGGNFAMDRALVLSKTYFDDLETLYDSMARGKDCKYVELTYSYRQKGSNDGAYWLTSVKFL